MITLIAGMGRSREIGKDQTIPWHVPEDLSFFKRETLGGALIMGRKTWESLPVKPLGHRLNIVVSSGEVEAPHVVQNIDAAIITARSFGISRIYGIGGAAIYREMLPISDRLLLTHVDISVPDADTYFPPFPLKDWHISTAFILRTHGPRAEMVEYLRKYSSRIK